MVTATLTEMGFIAVPAEIRARYELTPGTELEFVDEGGAIRLLVRRRATQSDPAAGYGMVKIASGGKARALAEFDVASVLASSKVHP